MIELVLVMVIVCVAVAVVAPKMGGFARGRYADNAATQFLAVTHWARAKAISEGAVLRLSINTDRQEYRVTALDVAGYASIAEEGGRTFGMPEGVRVETDAAKDADGAAIHFYPTGRIDPAEVRLTGGDGRAIRITNPSATESFRIVPAGGRS